MTTTPQELPDPSFIGIAKEGQKIFGYLDSDVIEYGAARAEKATEEANARQNASWKLMCEKMVAIARREALEEAAMVCETTPPHPFRPSIEAAHAIRQLIKEQP